MPRNHPFPPVRPAISITESEEKFASIDLSELQWWPVVPGPGHHSMQAIYEADTLELSSVTEMVVTGPARVHNLDCVEIAVQQIARRDDWDVPGTPQRFYASLDEKETRWLAVVQEFGGRKVLRTIADDGFESDWGKGEKREIRDEGRYERQPDGTYRTTGRTGIGAGTYELKIGANTFRCLRVWDTGGLPPSEQAELSEAYIEPGGHVVLFREYWGRRMGKGDTDWLAKYPNNLRIEIDGCVYVHCDCTGRAHDLITNTSLGVELP